MSDLGNLRKKVHDHLIANPNSRCIELVGPIGISKNALNDHIRKLVIARKVSVVEGQYNGRRCHYYTGISRDHAATVVLKPSSQQCNLYDLKPEISRPKPELEPFTWVPPVRKISTLFIYG